MEKTCENCKYSDANDYNVVFCKGQKGMPVVQLKDTCEEWRSKYKTNADRLRAMSDEELAEFLSKNQKIGGDTKEHRDGFYLLWLDWLREEVDND